MYFIKFIVCCKSSSRKSILNYFLSICFDFELGHVEFNGLVSDIAFQIISGKTDIFNLLNDIKGCLVRYKYYFKLLSDKKSGLFYKISLIEVE